MLLHTKRLIVFLVSLFLLSAQSTEAQTRSLTWYLDQAYEHDPVLKDNLNQIRSASIDSSKIRAAQMPLVSANALAQYAPEFGKFGYDLAISNGGTYIATVNVSQPFLNKGIIRSRLQGVQVKKDSIRNQSLISRLDLKKNVINQYIQAYSDLKQLRFQQELFKIFGEQEDLLKKLVRTGVYKQSDYLTFLVSKQAQEVTIIQVRSTYHTDLAALNQACGIADTASISLEEPDVRESVLAPVTQLAMYQKYTIDSLGILNARSQLAAAYRPKLNWFADAGNESSVLSTLYRTFGLSFGLNFSVPIYDGHQKRLSSKQLDLTEQTRVAYRSYFELQYKQQVLALQKQLSDTDELLSKLNAQIQYAKMLVDIDSKLLNTGDLKINDYLLAVNSFRSVQFTLTQQEVNRLMLINQLNYWSTSY